jgi:hypothetical protein
MPVSVSTQKYVKEWLWTEITFVSYSTHKNMDTWEQLVSISVQHFGEKTLISSKEGGVDVTFLCILWKWHYVCKSEQNYSYLLFLCILFTHNLYFFLESLVILIFMQNHSYTLFMWIHGNNLYQYLSNILGKKHWFLVKRVVWTSHFYVFYENDIMYHTLYLCE